MSEYDDDLRGWRDDPVVRALRAPGSASELAGEREMVVAYRRVYPRRSLGRAVGRMGVGGTAVVTAIALSSGVAAAAYTQTLPDPVQTLAHRMLEPIGVPAPAAKPRAGARSDKAQPRVVISGTPAAPSASAPTPTTTETSTPTATPVLPRSPVPTAPRSPQERRAAPVPTSPPAPSPTPAPTSATPTPTPGRAMPAALTIQVDDHRVPVGATVTVTGVVTSAEGSPVPGRRVVLRTRTPGAHHRWMRVETALSGEDGTVSFKTAGLAHTTLLRLRAGVEVRTAAVRVVVVPTVEASAVDGGVQVDTVGGRPGDTVVLVHRRHGRMVRAGTARLDVHGQALIPLEPRPRAIRYVVRLVPTPLHAAARAQILVPAAPR